MIETHDISIDGGHGELSLKGCHYSAEGWVDYETDDFGGFDVLDMNVMVYILTDESRVRIHNDTFEYRAIVAQVVAIAEREVGEGG
jgi:hypothetical protein